MNHGKRQVKCKIPIQSVSDVELACTGAIVSKATLEINDVIISVVKPDYTDSTKDSIMLLNFLGGVPLRTGLLKQHAHVILESDGVASLMFHEMPATKWSDLNTDHLTEDVTVGTEAGYVKNKIIYFQGVVHLAV